MGKLNGENVMTKTVLITGASGFIGKHIVLQLLEAGYNVRGSVRNQAKADEVKAAIKVHLKDQKGLAKRLSFVELDLTSDKGWDAALVGVDALLHTASPFPLAQPKHEDELIRPAVDGTLRALKSAKAAGVRRVVLTSSVAAVYAQNPLPDDATYNEDTWTDLNSPAASAYVKSKTLAERAAWEFVNENPEIKLTTINPCLVLGPALDTKIGSSLELVQRVMQGKDPALPALCLEVVDVRDIAKMHVAALSAPKSEGQRVIGSSGDMWFRDMARLLKAAHPDRKISTRQAPNWFIRLYSLIDPAVGQIVASLGKHIVTDNSRARSVLGIEFISAQEATTAAADFLVANDLVG